jgi:hypothetical protein
MDRRTRWSPHFLLTLLNLIVMRALPISFISAASWAESYDWGLLNDVRAPAGMEAGDQQQFWRGVPVVGFDIRCVPRDAARWPRGHAPRTGWSSRFRSRALWLLGSAVAADQLDEERNDRVGASS